VHHQGVEIVGEAAGGGGEPALVEVVDKASSRRLTSVSEIASSNACQ
jgi:hypothetical protein